MKWFSYPAGIVVGLVVVRRSDDCEEPEPLLGYCTCAGGRMLRASQKAGENKLEAADLKDYTRLNSMHRHPAFDRYRESYPRRSESQQNCYSRAGDERSAVLVGTMQTVEAAIPRRGIPYRKRRARKTTSHTRLSATALAGAVRLSHRLSVG
jgi:hypothetical protein